MKTSNKQGKSKVLRIIGITAAALTACGGATCLFLKRRAKKKYYKSFGLIAAVMLCGVMMCGAMTAYAAPEPDAVISNTDTDAEPDEVIEVITGEEIEIDIADFIDPDREPNQITPPGNLTLVDDFDGAQASDKQFITVTTKNGNYFYIIIDRAGNKENVYFLNLVDEYDLMQILQGEDAQPPAPLLGAAAVTPEPPPEDTPGETPTEQPKQNNSAQLLLIVTLIAAVGGGAFYWFKVRKPKQSGKKTNAVKSELDDFDFDADDYDYGGVITDGQDGGVSFEGDADEEIPDFTAAPDNSDISVNIEESEDI